MQFQRSTGKLDFRQYLGVRCRYCQKPILFGLDQSRGSGPIVRSFVKLVLTCSAANCFRQADYSHATVSRYTKQTGEEPAGEIPGARPRA